MKKYYKNIVNFKTTPDPEERRRNISKEIIRHEDYMPKTLTYEDIDRSFKEWVEKNIELIQDGKKLPTMVLYSNQRFSEYMQTWQYTDENNNIRFIESSNVFATYQLKMVLKNITFIKLTA